MLEKLEHPTSLQQKAEINIVTNMTIARQRFGNHHLKPRIAVEVEVQSLDNGQLARVPAAMGLTDISW
jgi:hypothetical protein